MGERISPFALLQVSTGTLRHVLAFCKNISRQQCRSGNDLICSLPADMQREQKQTKTDSKKQRSTNTVGGRTSARWGIRQPADNRSPRGVLKGRGRKQKKKYAAPGQTQACLGSMRFSGVGGGVLKRYYGNHKTSAPITPEKTEPSCKKQENSIANQTARQHVLHYPHGQRTNGVGTTNCQRATTVHCRNTPR